MDLEKFSTGGLWVPAQEQDSDWLLVAVHGSGGSAKDFEGLEDVFGIPSLNYLYLNGPIPDYSGYRWYSDLGPRTAAYEALRSALDVCIAEGYPPTHIILMGFSQGAALSIEFGVRYSHLLGGYIAISGRVENLPGLFSQGDPEIINRGRFLITHGTRDYNLSIELIRQQVERMREGGLSIDFREFDKIHEFESTQELPYIRNWILSRITS